MSRGRKPKPTRLKILRGNPGKRPLPAGEPQPQRGAPPCPEFLHPIAREAWAELVPHLDRLGLLTLIDGQALACHCQAWAEFRLATEMLDAEGRTCLAGTGGLKPHPAIAMQRSAWKAVKDFAAVYGLDPSSRSKLKAPPPADDRVEDFLSGKVKR